MRRITATIAISIAACAGVIAPVGTLTAAADPIGSCTTTTGTVIAVDYSHWGGPLVRGCGVNSSSGYALLHTAGFTTAGDNHDGPAFICRIGNQAFQDGTQYPTPAQDPCIVTPPAAAYWSYWTAPAGQNTWSYSRVGAATFVPKPGEVELWIFGGTNIGGTTGSGVPSFSPDSVRAHNANPIPTGGTNSNPPTTRTSPSPTTKPNPGAPGAIASPTPEAGAANAGASAGPTATTARGAVGPTGTTIAAPAAPGANRSASTTPSSTGAAKAAASAAATRAGASPKVVDALPAVHEKSSAGSVVPVLIVIAIVLALGGATAATLRRRRQLQ